MWLTWPLLITCETFRYVQQQQLTGYQGPVDLFCVVATYDLHQDIAPLSVPGFDGPVVGVYNYENQVVTHAFRANAHQADDHGARAGTSENMLGRHIHTRARPSPLRASLSTVRFPSCVNARARAR